MSFDAALGRIDAILSMEQQLTGTAPASSSSGGAAVSGTTDAAGSTAPTGSTSFAANLAAAQSSSAAASANAAGYVNPLAGAHVTPERIDQGVDYAGTGTLGALGPGVVTQVAPSGSGWEGGGYVEYRLTAGPYKGRYVYYAEGVSPTVQVGQTLSPGQQVATIVPGSPTGIEIGFGSGVGEASYASAHGGYSEGQMTAAGQAFSNLISSLGGPAGLTEGRTAVGSFS